MFSTITVLVVAIATETRGFPEDISEALWQMSHKIAARDFKNSDCVCLITESSYGVRDHMFPVETPVFHVQLPLNVIRNSTRITPG